MRRAERASRRSYDDEHAAFGTGSDDPGTASDVDIRPDPADEKVDLALVARLSTLGELVASIVHEINQPLGTIAMQANTCLARLRHDNPDLEAVGEGLVRIERAAMRAGSVIRGLMTLARRSGLQLADVDMNKVIGEVLTLARSEIGQHGITLDSNLDTGKRAGRQEWLKKKAAWIASTLAPMGAPSPPARRKPSAGSISA